MRHTIRNAGALALAIWLAGCAGSPDVADSSSQAAEADTASSVAANDTVDPNAIRCKTTTSTGSRIGKKVCRTNAEWEEIQRASREAAETIQRESLHNTGMTEGG